ncbi:MAG: TraM recognition domain-containing protein, partial [Longispora sp.]|nr:TraM recognition domain-containing protein [Longispora sp. (in: high G+C Gram-positive bacteria)]
TPLFDSGVMPAPTTGRAALSTVLDEAEWRVASGSRLPQIMPGDAYLVVILATATDLLDQHDAARIAALAHAGPSVGLHLLISGYSGQCLPHSTHLTFGASHALLVSPGGEQSTIPIQVDPAPPASLISRVSTELAAEFSRAGRIELANVLPRQRWVESGRAGLQVEVGKSGQPTVSLSFDDATPHWLVGGRSGAGKTAFLTNVLYGLCARYSPEELALYLLDFKEGVSFTEFTPTERDPSWIPHARAVGIESDREYGVAVLRELESEMTARARLLKRHGVVKLGELPPGELPADSPPRIVCVIDEFQVLFASNDRLSRNAVELLESLARKGRSYGIHLVLASQTVSGVEALYAKRESIFGQFAARIALPGGASVLDPMNNSAAALRLGEAVVNTSAGMPGHDTVVRFPDPHAEAAVLKALRHDLWLDRPSGSSPPHVFAGYAERHVTEDPLFRTPPDGQAPDPRARTPHPRMIVGCHVDVEGSTASFALDSGPGRHLAVLGPDLAGADILHAALGGLARQHAPGNVRFLLANLVEASERVCAEVAADLDRLGHRHEMIDANQLRTVLGELADQSPTGRETPGQLTYLALFGADAAGGVLEQRDLHLRRSGLDDLRAVLRSGPARGVHVLGWWRGLRRFSEDIGGSAGREDVSCLVTLNVPGSEVGILLGQSGIDWQYRPNRALFIDRHADRVATIVPYVRPGRWS